MEKDNKKKTVRVLDNTLTGQQIMEHLQIGKTQFYRLVKHPDFKCYKVGREWRIDVKDLEDFKNIQKENKGA